MKGRVGKTVGEVGSRVGKATTQAVSTTTGAVTGAAGTLGRTVRGFGHSVFGLRHSPAPETAPRAAPGTAPGIENYLDAGTAEIATTIRLIEYGDGPCESSVIGSVEELVAKPPPGSGRKRWINVDGLNPLVVNRLREHFGFHTLAAEDVIQTLQRPKVETDAEHLFLVIRMIQVSDERLKNEQVSLFAFDDTVLTFQELPGDVFDPVRKRIEGGGARFVKHGTDYLVYALLDSVVDHLFPLIERYGGVLEDLEETISHDPTPAAQRRLFAMKRDLSLLRRTVWPIREVIDGLYRDEAGRMSEEVKTYLRDVYDHAVQVIDIVETYRETASSLNDLYQSSVGNKMNEIMKVLTIMASFFIPITFVAGVYGMNFEHIPELHWKFAYGGFWAVCAAVSTALAIYFWRKGWIGPRD